MHQTTIAISNTDDQVRSAQVPGAEIDQAEDKSRQSEAAEAEGRRVGKLAILDLAIGTRLELTAKGRETGLAAAVARVDVGEGTVAEARGGFGGRVLLVRHTRRRVLPVGFFAQRVLVVLGGGHYEGVDQFEGVGVG